MWQQQQQPSAKQWRQADTLTDTDADAQAHCLSQLTGHRDIVRLVISALSPRVNCFNQRIRQKNQLNLFYTEMIRFFGQCCSCIWRKTMQGVTIDSLSVRFYCLVGEVGKNWSGPLNVCKNEWHLWIIVLGTWIQPVILVQSLRLCVYEKCEKIRIKANKTHLMWANPPVMLCG